MFLVDFNYIDMDKVTDELTEQHRAYIAKEYQKNLYLFGGRKVPRTGGILISTHEDISTLEQLLEADPFITAGAATYSITEFLPVMASEGFTHLLTQ